MQCKPAPWRTSSHLHRKVAAGKQPLARGKLQAEIRAAYFTPTRSIFYHHFSWGRLQSFHILPQPLPTPLRDTAPAVLPSLPERCMLHLRFHTQPASHEAQFPPNAPTPGLLQRQLWPLHVCLYTSCCSCTHQVAGCLRQGCSPWHSPTCPLTKREQERHKP